MTIRRGWRDEYSLAATVVDTTVVIASVMTSLATMFRILLRSLSRIYSLGSR